MLEVCLFGKFEVKHNEKPITISSRSAQSLFAYLILNPGTAHRREKLAGILWPESFEEAARDKLRHALWRLRKSLLLEPNIEYLLADELSISFNASAEYRLDAAQLENAPSGTSADELITVLFEYQGELLPGFYDEWVVLEREHLNSVFENKMALLISLLEDEKRWLDVLHWSERWISFGQKPEAAYRALMTAHGAKGDMSKVAAIYERCIRSLKEFGIEPSEQTRALYERFRRGQETFEAGPTIPVKKKYKKSVKNNLPVPLTSLIGREREIEEVKHLLSTTRLLTLTGPGGLGKTRLAIESSNRVLNLYKDGVWWVELAPLTDGLPVTQAIAQVLGVREAPDRPLIESVKGFLREKQLLLVFDNCEHLITICAQLAAELLTWCAQLNILTTSREPLGLTGEKVWSVPTLSVPNIQARSAFTVLMQYEGIQLFVDRASRVKSDFALTESNASSVLQICQRLDGIPLALELAAARVKMMYVDEVARRLDDRFNLLMAGSRTALPRHQTLRAAIDWSHDLLTESEQILFRRLAVFAGGFMLDAAEAVCGFGELKGSELLDVLWRLVDKSLIVGEHAAELSKTRYRQLETIREYGREKLGESGETNLLRQRHRDFFIAFAEQAEPELRSTEQLACLDRLEVEHSNLRSAWDSAMESDAKLASRLASALLDFWIMRGNPGEGREWLAQLLPQTAQWGQTARRARVLGVAGLLAYFQADYELAQGWLEHSLAIARKSGDKKQMAFALRWLGGGIAYRQGDHRTGEAYIRECLMIYQELQDQWGVAVAAFHLAAIAIAEDHYAEGERALMSSLARFQELGDRFWAAQALNDLGELTRLLGDHERAGQFYEDAMRMFRGQGNSVVLINPLVNLGWVLLHGGNYRKSRALFEEALQLSTAYGNIIGNVIGLAGCASVLGIIGKFEQATRLFGAVEALADAVGIAGRLDPVDQKEIDHYVAVMRGQMDEETFAKAWEEGRTMTLEQAIEFALKETRQ